MDANEAVVFPEDLTSLSLDQLTELSSRALAQFDALANDENIDDEGVAQLEELAANIENVTAAINTTKAVMAANRNGVSAASDKVEAARKATPPIPATEEDTEDDEHPTGKPKVSTKETQVPGRFEGKQVTLAQVQEHAPVIPDNDNKGELVITAAAPRYGLPTGAKFDTLDSLVDAYQNHAKAQVVTAGVPQFLTVATVQNEFEHVIDGQGTSLREFEYMAKKLRSADQQEALVAGGGWCAPSEIRYDFFNIACEDGMIDLPTFGVKRGGINHPVSPSLADVFTGSFTNATNPWLWTEADDIATVTGNVNKPCVRVTCPSFTERRLECYGICLTAGNLTDSAYPEATRNHLSLLMSAHYHAMNQRYIQQMVTLSTAAITMPSGTGGGSIAADLPDAVALAANDIRTRYGMCEDDILEVVLPRWAKDAIRGDLSRRSGDQAYLTMSDADINQLFTARRTRVQWVADWQVRGAGFPGTATALTAWPLTVDFMIYPAGTFVRGNGMSLDLGVVRDSVLNAENDHTAAWTEECHLIAKYGHESRIYRVPVWVGGQTGGTFTNRYAA